MGRGPAVAVLGMAVAVVALATVPAAVAAQSVTGRLIRQLNRQLLYMAVPIAVLVEAILFYAVWRFRGSDEPRPTSNNRGLELTWTVATGLVLLFVGTASFAVVANPYVANVPGSGHDHGGGRPVDPGLASDDATTVVVVAEQWEYSFRYPNANVTSDVLVLPTNRTVSIYVTSVDVVHSVHVPALGLKQDALPGQYNVIRTRLLEEGSYRLYCAEFCGEGHATMLSTVRVVGPGEFHGWIDRRANATGNGTGGAGSTGTSTDAGGPPSTGTTTGTVASPSIDVTTDVTPGTARDPAAIAPASP